MKSAAERAAEKIIQLNDYAISMSSVTEAISREYAELEKALSAMLNSTDYSDDERPLMASVRSALAKVRGAK